MRRETAWTAADAHERRAHVRHSAAELTWLNEIRLKYGATVSLIDLSAGGAQIETASCPLKPGATLALELIGRGEPTTVAASVLRAQITALAPQAVYRGALRFKRTLDLPVEPCEKRDGDAARPISLLHEHARLGLALKELRKSAAGVANNRLTEPGDASMAAALALLEAPAARRANGAFALEVSGLLRKLADDVSAGTPHEQMTVRLIDSLRRLVPTRAVVLISGTLPVRNVGADSVYFDVATPDSDAPPDKLIVEFAASGRLEEWHLQLLKAFAHLITVIKEVERLRRAM